MTVADEGIVYQELFNVIRMYSGMDQHHQVKALDLIEQNYTPFNNLPMEETREVVEYIFSSNGFAIFVGGRPSLVGVSTIVTVAEWGGYKEWGTRLLLRVLRALIRQAEPGSSFYPSIDSIVDGMQSVTKGLQQLSWLGSYPDPTEDAYDYADEDSLADAAGHDAV
ncbi:MAG TPA: hypothetical protein VF952_19740 [Chloroflexia bacterium]|jgi:hypothetical protein